MNVLVVDGDVELRRRLARALLADGHEVRTAEDARAAMVLLGVAPADVVIASARDELVEPMLKAAGAARIVLTALPDELERALTMAERGPHDLLRKPFDAAVLRLAVARAAPRAAAAPPGARALVAVSRAMRLAEHRALAARRSHLPVLVIGEPGTGRSSFAALACAPDRPPAVLPEGVDEALALANLEAWLDERTGRQLVVEELGALGPRLRARLLAHLEEPRGPLSTRIVSTATSEVRRAADAGTFPRALLLGASAVLIELPPLRRRREDLPVLAQEALARARGLTGRPELRLGRETIRALAAHPWPGNVRELETVILRAAAASNGKTILPRDLVFDEEAEQPPEAGPPVAFPAGVWDLPFADAKEAAVLAFGRAYFGRLLVETRGNVSEAARRAGLDRTNFRRARRRYTKAR